MQISVTISPTFDLLTIEFNHLPHLELDLGGFKGYQAWRETREGKLVYCIEYYFNDGTPEVLTEYTSSSADDKHGINTWTAILKQLKKLKTLHS